MRFAAWREYDAASPSLFSLFSSPLPRWCKCCWALVALGRLKSSVYPWSWRARSSGCPGFPSLTCRPAARCRCRACRDPHRGRAGTAAASPRTPAARAKRGWGCPCCRAAGVGAPCGWKTAKTPRFGACIQAPVLDGTRRRIYRGLFKPLHTNSGNRRLARCCLFPPLSGRAGHGAARPGTRGEWWLLGLGVGFDWGYVGRVPAPSVRDVERGRRVCKDRFVPRAALPVNFWLLAES